MCESGISNYPVVPVLFSSALLKIYISRKLYQENSRLWRFLADRIFIFDYAEEVEITCGAAVILPSTASILNNVPDILYVQQQFLVLGFSKGETKVLKNWSSCQNTDN